MAIRLPLKTVLSKSFAGEDGTGSVAGGVAVPFVIPQDTDNVVVKFTASVIGGSESITFQTTDDGGTTWYDVARTSMISNSNNTIAQFLNIPISGPGFRSTAQPQNSVAGSTNVPIILNTIGNTAASALAHSQVSGLPLLSQQARVFLIMSAAVSATDLALVEVKFNSQSATA